MIVTYTIMFIVMIVAVGWLLFRARQLKRKADKR